MLRATNMPFCKCLVFGSITARRPGQYRASFHRERSRRSFPQFHARIYARCHSTLNPIKNTMCEWPLNAYNEIIVWLVISIVFGSWQCVRRMWFWKNVEGVPRAMFARRIAVVHVVSGRCGWTYRYVYIIKDPNKQTISKWKWRTQKLDEGFI